MSRDPWSTPEESGPIDLVPLDLARLDEEELIAIFPTPVQAAGALLIARERVAAAPPVLARLSRAVKDAKRTLLVARAFAEKRAEGSTAESRRIQREADPEVIAAGEAVDDAELHLEYAREHRKSLSEDVEILRSLNANFRGEHR